MNKVTSEDDFARAMMLLAGSAEDFKPTAYYDSDGDCIEFLAAPDPFYAERIDDLVTVYYSQESHQLVGSLIKGVSRFYKDTVKSLPGFRLEIHDGPARLVHIFQAKLWQTSRDPQDLVTLTYRKLIRAARDTVIEGEFCFGLDADAELVRADS
jgi:hypothetical protein